MAPDSSHFDDTYTIPNKWSKVYLGRNAQVMQCIHKASGEERTVKIMKNLNMARQFEQENLILRLCIDQPNLPDIKDFYVGQKKLYSVMDNLDHPNVSEALIAYTLEHVKEAYKLRDLLVQVRLVVKTVLTALVFCHDKGIAHGSVSHKNVLVPKGASFDKLLLVNVSSSVMTTDKMEGEWKWQWNSQENEDEMDFMALVNEDTYNPQSSQFVRTHGRTPYDPPEIMDTGPTPQSDVWALGVLAFFLLTGAYPFEEENSDPREGIQNWHGIQDPRAKEFLSALLAYDPRARPKSCDIHDAFSWLDQDANLPINEVEYYKVLKRLIHTNEQHQLQVAARFYISTNLIHKSDREGLDEIFRKADRDGNSHLSKEEFATSLQEKGIPISPDEIEAIFESLDADGNGEISYPEFCAFAVHQNQLLNRQRLRAAFDAFDWSSTNYVTANDLQQFAGTTGGASVFKVLFMNQDQAKIREQWKNSYENIGLQEFIKKENERKAQAMIDLADKDGDGQISFEEFVQMMEEGSLRKGEVPKVKEEKQPRRFQMERMSGKAQLAGNAAAGILNAVTNDTASDLSSARRGDPSYSSLFDEFGNLKGIVETVQV